MSNWPTQKLGEICDILDSQRKPVTKRNRKPGPYHYYGATGVQDYVEDYIFDEPLVLVGEDGAKWGPGEETAYRAKGKYWVNNHAHVLRPHRDVLLDDWLVYFLNIADLSEYITGLTVKKLNQEKLRSIEIPLPPLSEQKRIVEKIEKVFAKIDEAQKLRESALADSAALVPSALHQVFSRSEKERWVSEKLSSITEVVSGGTPSTLNPKYWNGDIDWVTPKDLGKLDDIEISNSARKITKNGLQNSSAQLFPKGSIIFSSRAPIGHIAIAGKKMSTNQGCKTFVPGPKVFSHFLFYSLKYFTQDIRNLGIGATFTEVSKTQLENFKILLPPLAEQKKIVAYLDNLSEKTRRQQELQKTQLADFSALRQSVLYQAFQEKL